MFCMWFCLFDAWINFLLTIWGLVDPCNLESVGKGEAQVPIRPPKDVSGSPEVTLGNRALVSRQNQLLSSFADTPNWQARTSSTQPEPASYSPFLPTLMLIQNLNLKSDSQIAYSRRAKIETGQRKKKNAKRERPQKQKKPARKNFSSKRPWGRHSMATAKSWSKTTPKEERLRFEATRGIQAHWGRRPHKKLGRTKRRVKHSYDSTGSKEENNAVSGEVRKKADEDKGRKSGQKLRKHGWRKKYCPTRKAIKRCIRRARIIIWALQEFGRQINRQIVSRASCEDNSSNYSPAVTLSLDTPHLKLHGTQTL